MFLRHSPQNKKPFNNKPQIHFLHEYKSKKHSKQQHFYLTGLDTNTLLNLLIICTPSYSKSI